VNQRAKPPLETFHSGSLPAQQRVAGKVFGQSLSLFGKLLFYAADEDLHVDSKIIL
jgi:hypothetical protein